MATLQVKTTIPVRYVECDPMGVVHHSNYFIWYEIGRIALAKHIGVDFDKLPDGSPLQLPVVECSSRFRASARYGDVVVVETVLERPHKARLNFTYRVIREKGHQLLTEGATSHVLMKADGQILVHLPAPTREKIEQYIGEKL